MFTYLFHLCESTATRPRRRPDPPIASMTIVSKSRRDFDRYDKTVFRKDVEFEFFTAIYRGENQRGADTEYKTRRNNRLVPCF